MCIYVYIYIYTYPLRGNKTNRDNWGPVLMFRLEIPFFESHTMVLLLVIYEIYPDVDRICMCSNICSFYSALLFL